MNDSCPACIVKRQHSSDELSQFHPEAGYGYTRETGWILPEPPVSLEPSADNVTLDRGERSDGA
jgi:hypothetical protein